MAARARKPISRRIGRLVVTVERRGWSFFGQSDTDVSERKLVKAAERFSAIRALAGDFVEVWRAGEPSVTASEAAMPLPSTAATEQEHSRRQPIELAWTGPSTTAIPARQNAKRASTWCVSTGLRMSGSARKAAPVAEVECQVVRCVGQSRCRGRSISESDPTIQTARKHNTAKLERSCPGSREMRNRED